MSALIPELHKIGCSYGGGAGRWLGQGDDQAGRQHGAVLRQAGIEFQRLLDIARTIAQVTPAQRVHRVVLLGAYLHQISSTVRCVRPIMSAIAHCALRRWAPGASSSHSMVFLSLNEVAVLS